MAVIILIRGYQRLNDLEKSVTEFREETKKEMDKLARRDVIGAELESIKGWHGAHEKRLDKLDKRVFNGVGH